MDEKLIQQVELATMLVRLGVTTVDKIRELFASDGHDEATLAIIMADVDARIARRG